MLSLKHLKTVIHYIFIIITFICQLNNINIAKFEYIFNITNITAI